MATERTTVVVILMFLAGLVARPVSAQSRLSLADAIERAKAHNPDATAAAVAEREAAQRVAQARGGFLPRVDFSESWQRGNHPVFAFSSRLAQRSLTAGDLALDALNHPAATDNFRAAFTVEQTLFNRGTTASVRSASIGLDMAATATQIVAQDLTSAVTEAFGRVVAAAATVRSATAAIDTARADRELAGNRRDAGVVTDADVLQIDVHLARALEQHIQAVSDERVARSHLNQLMGEALTTQFALDSAASASDVDIADAAALEEQAVRHRPEIALARQQEQLAAAAVDAAKAAFLPHVSAQAGWEWNGATWDSRSSAWVVGAVARISLFNGLADKARLAEARDQVARRAIETRKSETMVRLDVQVAIARLEAARASEVVGRAAVESARESHRIIRDRYRGGLADASALLRAAETVQQAEARQISALVNVLTARANLQRAIGKL
jgi:outer membrane protein TolC